MVRIELIRQVVQAGAGGVLLNAVDRDGMMTGMDLVLISKAATISVTLITVDGIGCLTDIRAAVDAGASV